MLLKRDRIILEKVLEEIESLEQMTKGLGQDAFLANNEKKKACAMTFINIGELVKNLSKEMISTSNFPYNEIRGLRHVAAHEYYALRFTDIWNTIKNDISDLKKQIENFL